MKIEDGLIHPPRRIAAVCGFLHIVGKVLSW